MRTGISRALHQQLVERTALHRDLCAVRQVDADRLSTNRDEVDAPQLAVRQLAHALRNAEPLEHRRAGRIQTIAANFLTREFFAFEEKRTQTGACAEGRARCAGRAAADDRDIKHRAKV